MNQADYRNAFKKHFKDWLEDINYKMVYEKGTLPTVEQRNEIIALVLRWFNSSSVYYYSFCNIGYSSETMRDIRHDWSMNDACWAVKEVSQ